MVKIPNLLDSFRGLPWLKYLKWRISGSKSSPTFGGTRSILHGFFHEICRPIYGQSKVNQKKYWEWTMEDG